MLLSLQKIESMGRLKHFQREVNELQAKYLRDNMPEPKMLDASFCNDLPNQFFTSAWSEFKMPAGSIPLTKWINQNGFEKCNKSEATCLIMIGEKGESGDYLRGKYKSHYLKPINN